MEVAGEGGGEQLGLWFELWKKTEDAKKRTRFRYLLALVCIVSSAGRMGNGARFWC